MKLSTDDLQLSKLKPNALQSNSKITMTIDMLKVMSFVCSYCQKKSHVLSELLNIGERIIRA